MIEKRRGKRCQEVGKHSNELLNDPSTLSAGSSASDSDCAVSTPSSGQKGDGSSASGNLERRDGTLERSLGGTLESWIFVKKYLWLL